jgi:serine/threonine protein kinase
VKKASSKTDGVEYAMKVVKRKLVSKEAVESEVAILQALSDHRGIVNVHEIYESPKALVIVEQLLSGRLFDDIVVMDHLTEQLAIHYTRQLLSGLEFIHSKNIVHLDIVPENILLSGGDEPHVVISDFGEAMRLRSTVHYSHQFGDGNPEFAAPEVVAGERVSLTTDMWSLGVIVYVMLSGVSPFYSDNRERACANVMEIRYKFPDDFFADISGDAKDFIEELLTGDQTHRPDASECLQFHWLRTSNRMLQAQTQKRIALSRLAAFNARRRYQYELSAGPSQTGVMSSRHGKSEKRL